MKHLDTILLSAAIIAAGSSAQAKRLAYFPMEISQGQITETESGAKGDINVATIAESVRGVKGNALRLDGYSNFAQCQLNLGELTTFTFSVWCAMETWPIIEHDIQNDTDVACICGDYDTEAQTGCGFFVNRTGKFSFRFYSQGWPNAVNANDPLPLYQWNNLVAVGDGTNVSLYLNGVLVGSSKCKKLEANGSFIIGKAADDRKFGLFNTNTVNGIIDEIEILDNATDLATIQSWQTTELPSLTTVSDDKYADDIMRPRLHGMPMRNWTNETHGLTYYNGEYHLFFQKNANGPYMSRLQWGHLVSSDLCEWQEMPIALGSDKWFDLKGCWSGCVFTDNEITGGKPNIIYTGVDYARAMISQAWPNDDDLIAWTKNSTPIINGKPSGLSDDFRDPYFFRNGNDAYIIVGTSKGGLGACTLHKYNASAKSWSNDGSIFFKAESAAGQGTFWEMPNVTNMGDCTLFTATPLGTNGGVKALYWTGSINADGTFNPSSSATPIELPGFAKEGYGLLSPTIMQVDDKTIALGIVPDKLSSDKNYDLGWAHAYSLPREWSIADGKLVQKPYSGLEKMRDAQSATAFSKTISGEEEVGEMTNRQAEVIGEFTIADADFGFTFYKSGDKGAKLTYSPSTGKLTLDMRTLDRINNDNGVFNGLYESSLPTTPAKGSVMKLHVFVDHSIMDIFINDTWASSVRLFPTDESANGIEVFSDGGNTNASVKAWALNSPESGIFDIFTDDASDMPEYIDVYNAAGMLLRRNVHRSQATNGLPAGIYIAAGKKIIVK